DEKEGRGCRPPLAPLAPLAPQRPSKGPHQLQTEAPPARLALPASLRPARHFCPTASKISPSLASLPAVPRPYREIATSPTVTGITPVPVSLQLPCSPARDFQRQSDPPTLRQTARYEE
ncbi:hypothetical protein ElyMa_004414100, partial [Elysia marginata]